MPTLTDVPANITAGDSYTLLLTESDYLPEDGWSLRLIFNGQTTLTENSTAAGTAHAITIAATESAGLGSGLYRWIVRAIRGSDSVTVRSGISEVTPDLATALPGALKSWAEQMLDAIESTLLGVASDEMKSMMIDGRQLQKMSTDELMKARVSLRAEIAAQRRSFGIPVIMTASGFIA